jgi:uncharacterized protein YecT (DUF1311 family)
MKRTSLVRAIVLLSSITLLSPLIGTAQQRKKPKSCWDTAMTQLAMNECAGSELKAAQTKMAALLKKLGVPPDNPAQKAWEAYRDAQLEAIYPQEGTPGYGSVFPMCFAKLKTDLTEGRIRDLKALTTSGEGDVCYGLRPVATGRSNQLSSTPVNFSRTEIHRRVSGGCSASHGGN